MGKYFVIIIIFLFSCSKGNKMDETKNDKDTVYVYGYKNYKEVVSKFKISLPEAIKLAHDFNNGFQIGDHYFVIGDSFVFSDLANKTGVKCSGIYVNGMSGEVRNVKTFRVFESGDRDWKTIYSIRGLEPAKIK